MLRSIPKRLLAFILSIAFLFTLLPPVSALAAPSIAVLTVGGDGGGSTQIYNNGSYNFQFSSYCNGLDWAYLDFYPTDSNGNEIKDIDFTINNNNPELEIVRENNFYFSDANRLRVIPQSNASPGTYSFSVIFSDGFTVYFNMNLTHSQRFFDERLPARTIDTIMENGNVIDLTNSTVEFPNAVRFQLRDAAGNILSGQNALQIGSYPYEMASTINGSTIYFSMSTSRPSEAGFNFPIFFLTEVPGQPYYSLKIEQIETSINGKICRVPSGNYTVKVGLNSGDVAEASFILYDYQNTKKVSVALEDAVTGQPISGDLHSGQTVNGTVRYIADNGFSVAGKDFSVYLSGNKPENLVKTSPSTFTFTVDENADKNLQLAIHDTISNCTWNKDFTVKENEGVIETPEDPNQPGNEPEKQQYSVTFDTNGHGTTPQSMTVEVGSFIILPKLNDQDDYTFVGWKKDGTIYDGNASVQVTEDMHFVAQWKHATETNPDQPEDPSNLFMYINSPYMMVDSKIVTLDASPYIKNDRTYVPIRALAEGFGAEVEWLNDSRSVAITLNGKIVTMTIGTPYYWVDGQLQTMDVAPEIQSSTSRTFVPIRFAAEALGFRVDAQYGSNGLTESVLFSKV